MRDHLVMDIVDANKKDRCGRLRLLLPLVVIFLVVL